MVAAATEVKPAQAFTPVAEPDLPADALLVPESRPLAGAPLGYQSSSETSIDQFQAMLAPSSALPIDIIVGTLPGNANINAYAKSFKALGKVTFSKDKNGIRVLLTLPTRKADATLKALWAAGYTEAFALR
jgi:hypothetical protein